MKKQSKTMTFIIAAIAAAVWFGLTQGLGFLYRNNFAHNPANSFDKVILTMLLPYVIALPITYLILRILPKEKQQEQKLGAKETIRSFIIQSGISLPVMVIVSSIAAVITGEKQGTAASGITDDLVFYVILLLIFNPIMEEVLFRKLILERLLPHGKKFAILGSSILFALPHIYSQGVGGLFYTFILALVWGTITVKSGSIKQAVILHSLSNVWGCFLPLALTAQEATTPIYFLLCIIAMPIAAIVLLVKSHTSTRTAMNQ